MFLGLMLLFADAPFTEQSAMYSLVRCSRVQWVVGKLMYILLSCAVYYIFSLAVTVIFFSPNAFAGNVWSAPFYELVMRDAAASSYHITVDPKLFMPAVTPYLAAFYALALNLGYGFFCGSLLFLINLSGSRVLGFAVLSGYENNNLRAGKERQPLCRQFNLQKNKMIDMIIALQYNEAVKSGIENI